jgi:hypothetical protein
MHRTTTSTASRVVSNAAETPASGEEPRGPPEVTRASPPSLVRGRWSLVGSRSRSGRCTGLVRPVRVWRDRAPHVPQHPPERGSRCCCRWHRCARHHLRQRCWLCLVTTGARRARREHGPRHPTLTRPRRAARQRPHCTPVQWTCEQCWTRVQRSATSAGVGFLDSGRWSEETCIVDASTGMLTHRHYSFCSGPFLVYQTPLKPRFGEDGGRTQPTGCLSFLPCHSYRVRRSP